MLGLRAGTGQRRLRELLVSSLTSGSCGGESGARLEQVGIGQGLHAVAFKGRSSAEEVIEQRAEAVDIGLAIDDGPWR